MKLIIDIDDRLYTSIKDVFDLSNPYMSKNDKAHILNAIKNGIPYEDKIKQITDLLETEWGYEGIREDVSRILRGEAEGRRTGGRG